MSAELGPLTDHSLIEACLRGEQAAWGDLVSKYKQLVYSIPLRFHIQPHDAADIFQSVWTDVFRELPKLRKSSSMSSWLITVTTRKCFHWKRKNQGRAGSLPAESELPDSRADFPRWREDLEREQMIREALDQLPARCREMIKLLFYQHPPIAYRDLAIRLGLAEGSIGFIRGRCLQKLRRILDEKGF